MCDKGLIWNLVIVSVNVKACDVGEYFWKLKWKL